MPNRLKVPVATSLMLLSLAAPAAAAQGVGAVQPGIVPSAEAAVEGLPSTSTASPTPEATATPGPTPTPEPTLEPEPEPRDYSDARPPADASKTVKRVYRDYRRDGLISPCSHTLADLRDTRETITTNFSHDFPDFEPTLVAAIGERRGADDADADECATSDADPDDASISDGTSSDVTESGGDPTPTGVDSGDPASNGDLAGNGAPASNGGTGDDSSPTDTGGTDAADDPADNDPPADPLPDGRISDLDPADTPVKPAPLPTDAAPTVPEAAATPVPVTPPAEPLAPVAEVAPTPEAVARDSATAPAPVWGMAAGGGLLALGGLLAPFARAGRGARLAAFRHSWAEAGYRMSGAWQDFVDWLRVGR